MDGSEVPHVSLSIMFHAGDNADEPEMYRDFIFLVKDGDLEYLDLPEE